VAIFAVEHERSQAGVTVVVGDQAVEEAASRRGFQAAEAATPFTEATKPLCSTLTSGC